MLACKWCENKKQEWLSVKTVLVYGAKMYQVKCKNCGARGPIEESVEAAIRAWNKRS